MRVGRVLQIWRYPVKSMVGQRLDRARVGARGLQGDRGWAIRNEATGEVHNAKRHPVLLRCSAAYRQEPGAESVPHVEITLPDGTAVASDSPAASQLLSDLMRRRVALTPLDPAADAGVRRREPGAALMGRMWAFRPARRLLQRMLFSGPMGKEMRATFGLEPGEPAPDLSGIPGTVWEFYTPPGTYFDVSPVHVVTTSTLRLMAQRNPAADWDVKRFRPNLLLDTDAPPVALEKDWVGRTFRVGGAVFRGDLPTVRCAMPMHAQPDLPRDPSVLRTIVREASQCLGLYASVVEAGAVATGDPVDVVPR